MSKRRRKEESSLSDCLRMGKGWEEEWDHAPTRQKSTGRRMDRESRAYLRFDEREERGRYAYHSDNALRRMSRGRKPKRKKYYKKSRHKSVSAFSMKTSI